MRFDSNCYLQLCFSLYHFANLIYNRDSEIIRRLFACINKAHFLLKRAIYKKNHIILFYELHY